MIFVTIFSIIFYLAMTILGINFLTQMSALSYIALIYLVPPIYNFLVLKFQRSKILFFSSLLPLLASIFYASLSWVTEANGTWLTFVERNTISSSNFSLEIEPNGFDITQIIFLTLVYFGLTFGQYYLMNRKNTEVRGDMYA